MPASLQRLVTDDGLSSQVIPKESPTIVRTSMFKPLIYNNYERKTLPENGFRLKSAHQGFDALAGVDRSRLFVRKAMTFIGLSDPTD